MAVKDEPKRRSGAIPKKVKDTVWKRHFGSKLAEGPCYVCGETIRITHDNVEQGGVGWK